MYSYLPLVFELNKSNALPYISILGFHKDATFNASYLRAIGIAANTPTMIATCCSFLRRYHTQHRGFPLKLHAQNLVYPHRLSDAKIQHDLLTPAWDSIGSYVSIQSLNLHIVNEYMFKDPRQSDIPSLLVHRGCNSSHQISD